MENEKPREYFLTVYGGMVDKVFTHRPQHEHEPSIHVVEKSAFDQQAARIVELEECLKKLIEETG